MKIFQKFNLLPEKDFLNLHDEKHSLLTAIPRLIDVNGNVVLLDDRVIYRKNPKWGDWKNSLGTVINESESTDVFENVIGHNFTLVLKAIREVLIENNHKNPIPYVTKFYRNNTVIKWHRHELIDRSKNFISIYYTHPNWNKEWGGDLEIGWFGNENMFVHPCLSNSVVIHDGRLGHRVSKLSSDFIGNRDVFAVHWRAE